VSGTTLHPRIAESFQRQRLLTTRGGERFIARGRVVRVGRTVGAATAEVVAQSPGKPEVIVALMQATMMRVEPRDGAGV
jgi:acyl-coenzyme A thioesterase PaaI-like protein